MERNSHLKNQLEKVQPSSRIINGSDNGDGGDDIRDDDLTRSAMSLSCDEQHPHLGGGSINFFFKDDILSEYKKAEMEEELKSLKYENQLLKQDLMAKSVQNEQIVLLKQQQQQQQILQMNQHNQIMSDNNEILPLINDEVISLDNENFIEARRASQALLANQQHSDVTTDISETSPLVLSLIHI